ncbi:5-hydroxytryptamine receptor-like [Saccostrea echinata]|uniref:5-hydroxytryptamine receptor-like n=1 Tax=Saccostrea echinata TaxID=191078 RepID=UPI002A7FAB05|nr:5-hydroxytryptamine receptor-like [Saccostrea echinata]
METSVSATFSVLEKNNETKESFIYQEESVTHSSVFGPQVKSLDLVIPTTIFLGLMVLATIIGNVFVIAAIVLEKNLQNVANYLILSLAVADLMVATLVMPISILNEVTKAWFLQNEVCDMWITFDMLCCTASILHLVAISVDRYWAVTNIDYVRNRSAKTILIMIAVAWFVGLCIAMPRLLGWRNPDNVPSKSGMCMIDQDIFQTLFSTGGAFYVPTIIMLIIYAKIYQVARSRIRKKNFIKKHSKKQKYLISSPSPTNGVTGLTPNGMTETTIMLEEASCVNGMNGCSDKNDNSKMTSNTSAEEVKLALLPNACANAAKAKKQKEKLEMKRERKAARTLGIITGAYIVCWLPFFIIALLNPFLQNIPNSVNSIVLWLGYFNSLLNPIIYTIFNPEFRNAFQKILFGKYSRR